MIKVFKNIKKLCKMCLQNCFICVILGVHEVNMKQMYEVKDCKLVVHNMLEAFEFQLKYGNDVSNFNKGLAKAYMVLLYETFANYKASHPEEF